MHLNVLQQGGYQSRVFFVANCAQSLVQVTAMAAALKKAEDDKQVLLHQHDGHAACMPHHY
jgi:aspartate/tyrosine/aromatic aminotransferase